MDFKITTFNNKTGQITVKFDNYPPVAISIPIENGMYYTGDLLIQYIESFRPLVDISRETTVESVQNAHEINELVVTELPTIDEISKSIRESRNRLLYESDYTQLVDCSLTRQEIELWANYRQLLRDVPDQPGFPNDITWPGKPNTPITPVETMGLI
jgi:hypothetical protein